MTNCIHFNCLKVDKTCTVCKICRRSMRYTGNTTNMSTHLKRHHPENAPESTEKSVPKTCTGQLRLNEVFQSQGRLPPQKAQAITRQIGIFIATDLRPYSVIENSGFRQLINTMEPRYQLPSRPHFSKVVVPQLYEETKAKIKNEILSAS